jgi:hypothetical protein
VFHAGYSIVSTLLPFDALFPFATEAVVDFKVGWLL